LRILHGRENDERTIVTRSIGTRIWSAAAIGAWLSAAILLFSAGPARAATDVYPAGGSTFTGGAEGWEVTSAGCSVAVLCTAEGGYDGGDGHPPGSIAANTTIGLNLLTLFKSTVTLQSPDFKVSADGDGTLHLDRQFASGSLVDLAPEASYEVTLLDRTAGTKSEPLSEDLKEASPFVGKDHAATVKAGHTYALSIATEVSSTVAGTALLGGTTSLRFDNVALTVQAPAGGGAAGNGTGAKGGNGGNGLTDARLLSLLRSSAGGSAVLRGNRLFVKRPCPAQIGSSCRVSIQGLLKRRKPATTRRTAKVARGRAKMLVLKVKPAARAKLVGRKRLLFKQTVKAGGAKATVYKHLKLIRRR
jgi:hypothetical protein